MLPVCRAAKVTTIKLSFARLILPRKILEMKRENLQLKRYTNIATMPLSRNCRLTIRQTGIVFEEAKLAKNRRKNHESSADRALRK